MSLSTDSIGKKLRSYSYTIERGKIREFCEAIGETNPVYLDPEAARAAGFEDTPIPPTFQTTFQFWGYKELWDDMLDMGVDTDRLLHMKEEYTFLKQLYPGDVITSDGVVDDVRTGKMNMAIFKTIFNNQKGEPCIEAKFSIIIRPEEAKTE